MLPTGRRKLAGISTIVAIGLIVSASSAGAATLTVSTKTDETSSNNTCSLREAIAAVDAPGTATDCGTADSGANVIVLAAGSPYSLSIPPVGGDENSTGDLNVGGATSSVTIMGHGATIDASSLGDRVLTVGNNAKVTLNQLTLNGGHAFAGENGSAGTNGSGATNGGKGGNGFDGEDGGAIFNDGTLTLTGVAITNSSAGAGGTGGNGGNSGTGTGGTAGDGGNGGNGGAVFNNGAGAMLTLTDSKLMLDYAGGGGSGGTGGCAGLVSGVCTENGSSYTGGSNSGPGGAGGAGGAGGGIYNLGGTVIVTASTITQNSGGYGGSGGEGGLTDGNGRVAGAGGAGGHGEEDGGGIASDSGHLTITGSTIAGNSAGRGGGGGTGGKALGTASQAGAGGNGGDGSWGGGISVIAGSMSLANSTLSSNSAGYAGDGGTGGAAATGGDGGNGGAAGSGGNIRITDAASASVLHGTIAGGVVRGGGVAGQPDAFSTGGSAGSDGATGHGGGLFVQGPGALVLQNTIVASSTAENCASTTLGSAFSDGGHNLSFGDTTCPGGNGDPKLGGLQDNGGPTQTMDLGTGSAALDEVPASGAGCAATDQRGVARPQGSGCDIGAFEVAPPVAVTGAASRVTAGRATVAGGVTANQADAIVTFEYGRSTAYGAKTSVQHVRGVVPVAVIAGLTGLKPNTTYHYRVDATSVDGTRRGSDRTFRTRSVVPVLSNLHETNRAWVEGNGLPRVSSEQKTPVGTTFGFTLNEPASVRFAFEIERSGRMVGKRCVAVTRRNAGHPACTRPVPAGSLSFAGHLAMNSIAFEGRVSTSRKLRPGRYRLVITADAAGRRSLRHTLRFTLIKR